MTVTSKEKRKKLVMLINSLEGGGAEKVFSLLSEKLSHDFSVTFIVLDDRPIVHPPPKNVAFKCLSSKIPGAHFIKFALYLRKLKPAVVLSFLTRANHFNILSNLFWSHRTVICERSTASGRFADKSLYHFLNRMLIRLLYPFADCITANSQGGANDLIDNFSIPKAKTITIYNPFDIREIQRQGKSHLDVSDEFICAIGRLHDAKRFDLLIRAYAAADIQPKLFILGDGHLKYELESLLTSLNLNNKVQLLGYKSNPYAYIKRCKFFILSSQREGFPNGLTEALILQKAVVATNCKSGPREILDPEYTGEIKEIHWGAYGMLVPPNNVKLLANALTLMENSPEKLRQYENKSLQRAQEFHIDSIYQSYKQVLQNEPSSC